MAWIELHQSLINNKKTILLADILDVPEVQVIGHLVSFWLWCVDNAQDGTLEGITPRMVARAAQWSREPETLMDAMEQSGFLDRNDDRVEIHDWFDYAGRLIEKKSANAERMREARAKTKKERATHVQRTKDERAMHVQGLPTNQPTYQPTNSSNATPTTNEMDLETYCQQIEIQMIACGASEYYKAKDKAYDWVKKFHASGVPIDFVCRGIVQAYAKNPDISTFTYCAKVIKDEWSREVAKYAPTEPLRLELGMSSGNPRAAPVDDEFLTKFAIDE